MYEAKLFDRVIGHFEEHYEDDFYDLMLIRYKPNELGIQLGFIAGDLCFDFEGSKVDVFDLEGNKTEITPDWPSIFTQPKDTDDDES